MFDEFKKFVMRGNVMDLAVGVIIGTAFGKIVSSFVSDIIMPVIGMVLGRVNFADLFISLNGQSYPTLAAAQEAGAPVIAWGNFLNNVIDFLIVALVIFLLVKGINKLTEKRAPAAPAAPATKECPYCVTTIPVNAVRCPNCTSQLK